MNIYLFIVTTKKYIKQKNVLKNFKVFTLYDKAHGKKMNLQECIGNLDDWLFIHTTK